MVAALPAVEVSVLLYAFFRRSLLDQVPGVINDAIDYWLEAQACFSTRTTPAAGRSARRR